MHEKYSVIILNNIVFYVNRYFKSYGKDILKITSIKLPNINSITKLTKNDINIFYCYYSDSEMG